MKEYEFWKIAVIFMLTQLVCIGFNISITKYLIEKHSVHPLYGSIEKASLEVKCQPWDSCR